MNSIGMGVCANAKPGGVYTAEDGASPLHIVLSEAENLLKNKPVPKQVKFGSQVFTYTYKGLSHGSV